MISFSDPLGIRVTFWYAIPNDEIGGWSIVTEDGGPSSVNTGHRVADVLTEDLARHIVQVHNQRLYWEQLEDEGKL